MSTSSDATAGTNATATQYNEVRDDAIFRERVYVWFIPDTLLVANEQGFKYVVPENETVTKITHKTGTGTATIRLQKDTTDIDAGISVTTSVATETTITSPSLTAGQIVTLDITATSSGANLTVQMHASYDI